MRPSGKIQNAWYTIRYKNGYMHVCVSECVYDFYSFNVAETLKYAQRHCAWMHDLFVRMQSQTMSIVTAVRILHDFFLWNC